MRVAGDAKSDEVGVSKYRNDCASQSSLPMGVLCIVAKAQNVHSCNNSAINQSIVARSARRWLIFAVAPKYQRGAIESDEGAKLARRIGEDAPDCHCHCHCHSGYHNPPAAFETVREIRRSARVGRWAGDWGERIVRESSGQTR